MKKIFNLLLVLTLVFVLSAFEAENDDGDYHFTIELEEADVNMDDVDTEDMTHHEYAVEEGTTATEVESYEYQDFRTLHYYVKADDDEVDLGMWWLIDDNDEWDKYARYFSYDNEFDEFTQDGTWFHFKITDFHENLGVATGGYNSNFEPGIQEDETTKYTMEKYEINEVVFDNLNGIASGTIDIFETAFSNDGIIQVFYDGDANDGDGEMTVIGILSLVGVGFVLVHHGFKYVVKLLRFRG